MRNRKLLLSIVFAIVGLHRAVLADEGASGISVGALSAVQSETILYKAQGERDKALREIKGGDMPASQPFSYPYQSNQPVGAAKEPLPVVKLVSGSTKSLRVSLLYSGGFEIDAQVGGPELPGGYKLENISMDNVVVSRNGKRYSLGFSSTPPVSTSPALPVPNFTGLPGAPMGMPAPVYSPGQL